MTTSSNPKTTLPIHVKEYDSIYSQVHSMQLYQHSKCMGNMPFTLCNMSGCTYKYAHMHTCTRTHTHHVNKMSGDSIYFRHSQTTGNPFKSCSQPLLKQKLSRVNVISKEVKAKYLAQDNYAHTWSQCRCKSSVEKEKRVSLSHFPNLLLLHVWRQAA